MTKTIERWVISANRLMDGASVVKSAEGWSSDYQQAVYFDTKLASDAALAELLSDPEVIAVEAASVGVDNQLKDLREQMRETGPSIHPQMRQNFIEFSAGAA